MTARNDDRQASAVEVHTHLTEMTPVPLFILNLDYKIT